MPGAKEQAALAESGDEEPGDPRLRLLGTFVARSLRPAAGTWERCAGTAEAGRLLQAFLDHNAASDPRPLLVVQSGPGGLVVTPGLDAGPEPSRARAKGLFFLRTKSEPPGNHSLRGTVLCGDLPAVPLEHLAPLLSEVIIPVLANEKNHLEWPHMVCQDIRHHAHTLKSDLLVIFEHMKGRTLLPLPVGSEKLEFVDGHSEPVCEDLEHIYNQLMTIKVKGMAELLDKLQSSYLPAFKAMFRDVEAALTEAQDIHVHLLPLQQHLDILENVEFPKVKGRLRPLLHVVCLIWATCKWYRSPGRLTVLLQEICNLLIQQASNYLSPEDLLRSEVEESQKKLQVVSDTLSFFKQAFQDRREHLHTYFKEDSEVRVWDFQASLVFVRLDGFLGRVHMVEENLVLFAADPASSIWKSYVNYIDSMLLDGFFLAIECSLKYLLENTGTYRLMATGYDGADGSNNPCCIRVKFVESGQSAGYFMSDREQRVVQREKMPDSKHHMTHQAARL